MTFVRLLAQSRRQAACAPLGMTFPTSQIVQDAPQFAEVAVPLPMRQTFTYRLPFALREEAKLGARLLVPFGNQQLTGYIVALHETLDENLNLDEKLLKDALELIDVEPLITNEILHLTKWVADYYASSWGEVLRASLPSGLNATIEQIVKITENGREELAKTSPAKLNTAKGRVLQILSETAEISLRELSKKIDAASAKRAIRELVKSNSASILYRALTTKTKPKQRKAVKILPPEFHQKTDKPLTAAHEKIIAVLLENGGEMIFTDLIEKADVSSSAIQSLEKRGFVQVFVTEVWRDPMKDAKIPEINDFSLTEDQSAILAKLENALETNSYKSFLLHGVTGSGKTEIYIRAMRFAMNQGKTALMLVPEISLTPVFSRRLRSHFGSEVAIFHSNLSAGERFDEWRRIRRGEARCVIGTRSAIFVPLENIGIIVVDEEHDSSYRQQESPFYHGRDTAVVRARNADAIIVLGSATPALETFYNAKNAKYEYLRIENRVGNRPMAKAEIVDMRDVFKINGKDEVFSNELLSAIGETHSRGEQTIILLNRRGFSQFVLCRTCGESIKCDNCDVTLTFHRRENVLVCHYCNLRKRTPAICPNCSSKFIFFIGEGTEQLEDILRKKFPKLKISRIDRDTMSRRHEFEETMMAFSDGNIDMLVGTQMIAKGHDFPNVTLVGVVSVDAGLSMPDFRSAEKTFQLITQVAGRAGRGEIEGRVIIQTFHPEHYAIRHACAQDYDAFFNEEIKYRKNLNYPPFVVLASFLIRHENLQYAMDQANILWSALNSSNSQRTCRILGPAPAPLARLKGEHRLQMLVKARNRAQLREVLDKSLAEAAILNCDLRIVSLEIDPMNLL